MTQPHHAAAETPPDAPRRPYRPFSMRHYRPLHAKRGVCFLHVPKTAGSYLGRLFEHSLGPEACDLFMARAHEAAFQPEVAPIRADFISGHVNLFMAQQAGLGEGYGFIMLLRDPIDRLVSHLNWIDRFNHGIDPAGYEALSDDRKRLVLQIAQTDPEDAGSLRRLFFLDELAKAIWLFNRQTATLCVRAPTDILSYVDLCRYTGKRLRRHMAECEVCTTLPQLHEGLQRRGVTIPSKEPVNAAQSARFTRTERLEHLCRRYVEADQRLYRIAQSIDPDLDRIAELILSAQKRLAA